ncbi:MULTISPECIES: CidA/LrgA family protein [unclassified Janthinobacterium]|uniref:CidA/LrgA family protein n=1 Tax=unclassified Janthinobacterium TaxID=2610881 RepID=UPI0018CAC3CF|nr:CidA/LrgA family protein [Janthinobacterium sp. CG_23.4]MDH6158118.1 holin-like protein [Janthinobacterium sp. CG_23.4]
MKALHPPSSVLPSLPAWRQSVLTAWQVGILIAAWWLADEAASALHLPFSGGVVGLFVLVALLLAGWLQPAAIELGANWLLANMLLFFIPLVVSVVQFTQLLKTQGVMLFVNIGLGFASVMLATALTVEWVCRYERKLRLQKLLRLRAARAAA